MSFISEVESLFVTTEQDVVNWIADIKQGLAVAEADITNGLNWVASEVPNIVTALQATVGLVEQVGLASNPGVAAAIVAANVAVAGLNAFAAAQNAGAASGTSPLQADAAALVAGFTAVKQSQAAVALATAAAASAPAATPAPAAPAAS